MGLGFQNVETMKTLENLQGELNSVFTLIWNCALRSREECYTLGPECLLRAMQASIFNSWANPRGTGNLTIEGLVCILPVTGQWRSWWCNIWEVDLMERLSVSVGSR